MAGRNNACEMKDSLSLTKFDWLVILVSMALYYLLVREYIGAVDDVMYGYMRINGHIQWDRPVTSIFDALRSQCEDFYSRNGRFVVHTVVQYLCGMSWGRSMFFFVSTLFFGILLCGLFKTIRALNAGQCQPILAILILFTLIPVPGQTYFGNIAFTANYLWTSAVSIWVIYWFIRLRSGRKYGMWHMAGMILIGAIGGAMHEGFSLPISGMLFIQILLDREKAFANKALLFFCIAYWIGTLSTVLAPANFLRSSETTYLVGYGQGIFKKIVTVTFGLLKGEYVVRLFVIISIICAVWRKKLHGEIKALSAFFVVGLLSLAFDIFVAYIGCHQLTPLALMTTVILGSFAAKVRFGNQKLNVILNCMAGLVVIVFFVTALDTRAELKKAWEEMHKDLSRPEVGYGNGARLLEIVDSTPNPVIRLTSSKDAMLHLQSNHWFETLSAVIASNMADAVNVKHILPDRMCVIFGNCKDSNALSDNVFACGSYLIARVPKDKDDDIVLEYSYKPGFAGKIKRLVGFRPAVEHYQAPRNAHEFSDSLYRYVPIFVNPDRIESCALRGI